jgi:hypothetical protein
VKTYPHGKEERSNAKCKSFEHFVIPYLEGLGKVLVFYRRITVDPISEN